FLSLLTLPPDTSKPFEGLVQMIKLVRGPRRRRTPHSILRLALAKHRKPFGRVFVRSSTFKRLWRRSASCRSLQLQLGPR
ncbi:hypothetical protein, partial [Rhodoblastus acidophilus]